MSTAQTIIEDALTEIRVKALGIDLHADYVTRGIRTLNLMMAAWAAKGMGLGYTTLSASTDNVTVPDWAEEYVVMSLAMRMAESFGKDLTSQTVARWKEARECVLQMTVKVPDKVYYPSTLPVGAGNEGMGGYTILTDGGVSGDFYGPQHDDDLLDGNGEGLTDSEGSILEE